jgi:hypothetical protein
MDLTGSGSGEPPVLDGEAVALLIAKNDEFI